MMGAISTFCAFSFDEVAQIHWVNRKAPHTHPHEHARAHIGIGYLHEIPTQGLSHTHAPALQTPFRLQSMLFLHPFTPVTTIATITTITIVERILGGRRGNIFIGNTVEVGAYRGLRESRECPRVLKVHTVLGYSRMYRMLCM